MMKWMHIKIFDITMWVFIKLKIAEELKITSYFFGNEDITTEKEL
jgi:hypothetical protein